MRHAEWGCFAPQVCQLARDAGGVVMHIYESGTPADALLAHKADDSPLTLADTSAHHCIVEGLARLTPGIKVVSEEDTASLKHRSPSGSFWLVDPLDGTKEFLARNDEFTVNIALVTDGQPVWGVVYAPALDQLFWGGRGLGTCLQSGGNTQAVSVCAPQNAYRVIASKSHLNEATAAFIGRLGDVALVQAGSSLKFCRIAQGLADVYPRLAPTCEWDTAAAQAVVEGAGGYVYDTAGERLRYGKPDILNPGFIAASLPFSALPAIQ
jgi:3'(2'), 5'-bisphosphate nucleotidase